MSVAVSDSQDLFAVVDRWVPTKPKKRHLELVEPLEPFFCDTEQGGCGHVFSVKARQGRSIRAGQRKQLCSFCRGDRAAPRAFRVTEVERKFWLDRFSLAEIVEIAEQCWGPVQFWTDEWKADYVFEGPPCT